MFIQVGLDLFNLNEKPCNLDWITALDISPDGNYLVSGSLDKSVKIIDTKSLEVIKSLDFIHRSNASNIIC